MNSRAVSPNENVLRLAFKKLDRSPTLKAYLSLYQLTRFEPRLAEVFVKSLAENWLSINPVLLAESLKSESQSFVFAALIENAQILIEKKYHVSFRAWKAAATSSVKPAHGEIFWIGVYSFMGKSFLNEVRNSNKLFLRWGLYCQDYLVNKAHNREKIKLPPPSKTTRREALINLAKASESITVANYRNHLNGQISNRLAELDFKESFFLVRQGETKAASYRVNKRALSNLLKNK